VKPTPRSLRSTVLAVAAVAASAGCGGSDGTRLARADAAPLISLSHRIASEDVCAQARDIRTLQRDALRLINQRRVPRGLEETFLSGVSALTAQIPACVPVVPPTAIPSRSHGSDHRHNEHGKHKGQGD